MEARSTILIVMIQSKLDSNVGINRYLVVEPEIENARGYRKVVDDDSDERQLKDVEVFSPIDMLTPGTSLTDDPIRNSIKTY